MGISHSEMRENGFQRKERRFRELHTIATDVFCLGESQYFDFDSRDRLVEDRE